MLAASHSSSFGYRRGLDDHVELSAGLGAGSYGTVRKAVWKHSRKEVAVKSIPKARKHLRGPGLRRYQAKIRREVDTHLQLGKSLDVVHLEEVFEDNGHVHLVLELMRGGQLFSRSDIAAGEFDEASAASVMRSILRAIAQCHAKGVAFRDVKPENFMYSLPSSVSNMRTNPFDETDDYSSESWLKLSDFGLATFCSSATDELDERCGTVYYTAPEVVKQSYGTAADVWSAGVLAYQLISGELPFVDEEGEDRVRGVWRSILYSEPDFSSSAAWSMVSRPCVDFIQALLVKDPLQRPSASDALQYKWLIEDDDQVAQSSTGRALLPAETVSRLQRFATHGAVKQAIFRAVASNLDESLHDLRFVREVFNELDRSQRGSVNLEELQRGLQENSFVLTREETEQLFNSVDVDHSGDVTFDELAAALIDWHKLEQSEYWSHWATKAFHTLQRNWTTDEEALQSTLKENTEKETQAPTDVVTADELADAVCDVAWEDGRAVCRESVRDVVSEADSDSDGCIGLDEWLWLVQSGDADEESIYPSRRNRTTDKHNPISQDGGAFNVQLNDNSMLQE